MNFVMNITPIFQHFVAFITKITIFYTYIILPSENFLYIFRQLIQYCYITTVSKAVKTLIYEQKKLTSKPHQGSLRRADRTILIGDFRRV